MEITFKGFTVQSNLFYDLVTLEPSSKELAILKDNIPILNQYYLSSFTDEEIISMGCSYVTAFI